MCKWLYQHLRMSNRGGSFCSFLVSMVQVGHVASGLMS